ncbi:MAG: glutathione S-transferase family protein [Pseudomonadales bacterium]|nr:glutathione S-transferase family protein [Pseudomonadales bacterium]
MLKLHGVPFSNYYNMVKAAMLEKGVPFEEVSARPSQEPDFLARTPMGKVPFLETEHGCLTETCVILDYLEDVYPDKPLLPKDPLERARVREIAQYLCLYIELVGRRGFGVLRGMEVPEAAKASIRQDLPRGAAALARLVKFSPWIAGDTFTYADLVGYFTFIYAVRSAEENASIDLWSAIPGSKGWYDLVGERESVKKSLADQG